MAPELTVKVASVQGLGAVSGDVLGWDFAQGLVKLKLVDVCCEVLKKSEKSEKSEKGIKRIIWTSFKVGNVAWTGQLLKI